VAPVARPRSLPARPPRQRPARAPRQLVALFVAASALLCGLAFATAPAVALVGEVGGTKFGLQAREMGRWWDGGARFTGRKTEGEANAAVLSFANKSGNPVVHSLRTYVVYWDPQNYYDGDWQTTIDGFMAAAGSANGQLANTFAIDTQYRDTSNKPAAGGFSFQGAYTDTNPYPASACVDPRPLKFAPTVQEISRPV
jgi:hypothetical protein